MSRVNLTSTARIRPSSRSTIRSTSCSPPSFADERPVPLMLGRIRVATTYRATQTTRPAASRPEEPRDRPPLRTEAPLHQGQGAAPQVRGRRAGASGAWRGVEYDFDFASTREPDRRPRDARAHRGKAESWSWPAFRPPLQLLRRGSSRMRSGRNGSRICGHPTSECRWSPSARSPERNRQPSDRCVL
jgi:hypothetical protein